MYYPSRDLFLEPEKMGLQYENIFFENQDRQKLHAWWFDAQINFPKRPAKGTIVFFHGNAQNLTAHFAMLAWVVEKGYNLFIFDYPGYGLSEGSPDPYHCLISGTAALAWVHSHKDKGPLIVYGHSVGGPTALRAVIDKKNEIPIRAVIADSTFISFQAMGRNKLSLHWLTWLFQPLAYLLLSDSDAAKDVAQISPIPTLVIHGQIDSVVEPEFGNDLFMKLRAPKEIWEVPQGQHGDVYWGHNLIYRNRLTEWLDKT